jgi:hypothetical protein
MAALLSSNRKRSLSTTESVNLLPTRKPPLAEFRPGRQHCQIHDADYLQQILLVELDSSTPKD